MLQELNMRDYYHIKINLPGGIMSPGYLKDILNAALKSDVQTVRFGARQQLLMTVHYEEMRMLEKELKNLGIRYEVNSERFPNIISSYCGEDVFRTGQWLGANEYHTVLDSFDFAPELKVNISDSNQSFTPFFTGNLNFISSQTPQFWHLYIRRKQGNTLFKWPELIYTNEIGRISQVVEEYLLSNADTDDEALFEKVKDQLAYIGQPVGDELELPSFSLPYYEGFNRYGSRTWLGLYRRDEQFPVSFLIDLCSLCLKSRIGEICSTPWKSLIIKGIEDPHRSEWSAILGKHNINVRHAANELAWQTEDLSDQGSNLKKKLVSYIEKNDTRTFGLCFGIQTKAKSEVFGSILIRKRPLFHIAHLPLWSVYDLYFTENFNPNNRNHILFEKGLFGIHLPAQLERLCRKFSNSRRRENQDKIKIDTGEIANQNPGTIVVHQCPDCFTIYDKTFGDILRNIKPGISFEDLPDNYTCPTCDTPKSQMREISVQTASLS